MATTAAIRALYEASVVAIGGPPHSGKSVFLAALYRAIQALRPQNFVFLQRMCPDGEGMWSQESDPEVVREIRRKGKFAPSFLTTYLPQLQGLALMGNFRVVLADLGGVSPRESAENAEILAASTHLLLLCSVIHPEEREKWLAAAKEEGVEVVADFDSQLIWEPGKEGRRLGMSARSTIQFEDGFATGRFVNLDRDEGDGCYQAAIAELAQFIVDLVESSSIL